MDTILQLPDHADGTPWYVSPQDGIPAHYIKTHSLGHVELKPVVDKFINDYFKDLATSVEATGPQDLSVNVPHVSPVDTAKDGGGLNDNKAALNGGLLQVLNVGAADWLSLMAMIKEDQVSQIPDDVLLDDLVDVGEFAGGARKEAGKKKARKKTKDSSHTVARVLTFGSAHTEAIMQAIGDYGLTYLQLLGLGDNLYDFIPVERKTVLSRVLARSPINTHVVQLCCQQAKEGNRTLVMVSTPWLQL
jgi:hypothetical protein